MKKVIKTFFDDYFSRFADKVFTGMTIILLVSFSIFFLCLVVAKYSMAILIIALIVAVAHFVGHIFIRKYRV